MRWHEPVVQLKYRIEQASGDIDTLPCNLFYHGALLRILDL